MDKESLQSLVVGLLIMGFIVVGSGMSFLVREERPPTKPTAKTVSVATLSVKSGTLVTFTNKDKKAHQPASDPHPAHDSLPGFDAQTKLAKGQSYSFLFDKEGTYTYHDHLNSLEFKGTVVVGK
jgi:plastocyanin